MPCRPTWTATTASRSVPRNSRELHQADLAVQAKHGVSYLSYWFDPSARSVFCMIDAPSRHRGRGRASRGARGHGVADHRGGGPPRDELHGIDPGAPAWGGLRGARVPHDPVHRHRRLDRRDPATRRRQGDGDPPHPRPHRAERAGRGRWRRGEAHRRRDHGVVRIGRPRDRRARSRSSGRSTSTRPPARSTRSRCASA